MHNEQWCSKHDNWGEGVSTHPYIPHMHVLPYWVPLCSMHKDVHRWICYLPTPPHPLINAFASPLTITFSQLIDHDENHLFGVAVSRQPRLNFHFTNNSFLAFFLQRKHKWMIHQKTISQFLVKLCKPNQDERAYTASVKKYTRCQGHLLQM